MDFGAICGPKVANQGCILAREIPHYGRMALSDFGPHVPPNFICESATYHFFV
jgi:hypothetical protein